MRKTLTFLGAALLLTACGEEPASVESDDPVEIAQRYVELVKEGDCAALDLQGSRYSSDSKETVEEEIEELRQSCEDDPAAYFEDFVCETATFDIRDAVIDENPGADEYPRADLQLSISGGGSQCDVEPGSGGVVLRDYGDGWRVAAVNAGSSSPGGLGPMEGQ